MLQIKINYELILNFQKFFSLTYLKFKKETVFCQVEKNAKKQEDYKEKLDDFCLLPEIHSFKMLKTAIKSIT